MRPVRQREEEAIEGREKKHTEARSTAAHSSKSIFTIGTQNKHSTREKFQVYQSKISTRQPSLSNGDSSAGHYNNGKDWMVTIQTQD